MSWVETVPVIYRKDVFPATVGGSVIGANTFAGVFYLYLSLFHMEL